MSLEAQINVYSNKIELKLRDQKLYHKYYLPIPDSVNYDSNWTGISFEYQNPPKRVQRRLNRLAKEMNGLINEEPPNVCGIWTMSLTIPQCSKVFISDRGRVKKVREEILRKVES